MTRVREGVVERLLHIGPCPIRVRAWQVRTGVRIRAERIEPASGDPHRRVRVRRRRGASSSRPAIERMRFALALDDDMGDFFRTLQGRPADRRRDPPQAVDQAEAPAVALGGAGLGDHRAADRVLARGGDPEADGPPLGPARRARAALRPPADGRALGGADRRARPRRAGLDGPDREPVDRDGALRPRGRGGPGRPGRPRLRPPPARDPRDRAVDAAVRRAQRPRRPGLAARRATSST